MAGALAAFNIRSIRKISSSAQRLAMGLGGYVTWLIARHAAARGGECLPSLPDPPANPATANPRLCLDVQVL
jgi:hypothetical protein